MRSSRIVLILILGCLLMLVISKGDSLVAQEKKSADKKAEGDQEDRKLLQQVRRETRLKQSQIVPVFILDGYLGLSAKQQKIIEKLVSERWGDPISADDVYNRFPARIFKAIDCEEFRKALTTKQSDMYDSLFKNAYDLFKQLNSLSTQSQEAWAKQPEELLKSGLFRLIDELDSTVGLDASKKKMMMRAGFKTIQEIVKTRMLLHKRYSKIVMQAVGNDYALQLMMEGPVYQVGGSKTWQKALSENFSASEIKKLNETETARQKLCAQLYILSTKFEGHLNVPMNRKMHTELDKLLNRQLKTVFEKSGPKQVVSYFNLSRAFEPQLRENQDLKALLGENRWSEFQDKLAKRAESSYMNIPISEATAEQFAKSLKRTKKPVKFRKVQVTFLDSMERPAAGLKMKYSGFYIRRKNKKGEAFRLNSAYGLKPITTDNSGKCEIKVPQDVKVTRVLMSLSDNRFSEKTVEVLPGDKALKITLTEK